MYSIVVSFDVMKWLKDNAPTNVLWGSIGLIMANHIWPKYGRQLIKGYGPILANLHNLALIGVGIYGLYLLEQQRAKNKANYAVPALTPSHPMNNHQYRSLYKIYGRHSAMFRNRDAIQPEDNDEGDYI